MEINQSVMESTLAARETLGSNLGSRMKRFDCASEEQTERNSEENLEAPPGFEPGMEVLQTSALPLGDGADRKPD